jgi:phospholipase/carboxylesterase
MTNYTLEVKPILPLSEKKPKQIIILLHGYGGDGQDICTLAINWRRFLPDAIFLCPNAPEVCAVSPQGYQWYDLSSEKEDIILEKSLLAEEKIQKFIDEILEDFQLKPLNLALVGFSQGCMMGIQVALKKKEQISCLIGYSGKIINNKHLSANIHSKPKILLMHGTNDTIVSPTHLLEAKEYLINSGLKIKTKLFKDCEHRIPVEGVSLGLDFLRKNLFLLKQ